MVRVWLKGSNPKVAKEDLIAFSSTGPQPSNMWTMYINTMEHIDDNSEIGAHV